MFHGPHFLPRPHFSRYFFFNFAVVKWGYPFCGDALVAFIAGMSIDSDLLTYFGVALSRILENSSTGEFSSPINPILSLVSGCYPPAYLPALPKCIVPLLPTIDLVDPSKDGVYSRGDAETSPRYSY